ncbi:MAG: response regulator [Betaproteobacteria bacterium]|nr:response regulator [Betaproteobacteria bacterium]
MIADDEVPARNRMRELLADCSETLPVEVVGEAGSGQELLDALQQSPADVVFLDIRMPDMDGIETARHLQALATPPRIVFTTAYDTYAVKAFELHAIDYLLKPIRGRRLLDSLERASGALSPRQGGLDDIARAPRTHIAVQERGRVVLVPVKDIRFLRSELKYVTIRTEDREFLVEDSLTRLEQEFAGTFVRIHRSCLVARAYLRGFERQDTTSSDSTWLAVLEGIDEPLPVSRRQAHVIRDFGRGS